MIYCLLRFFIIRFGIPVCRTSFRRRYFSGMLEYPHMIALFALGIYQVCDVLPNDTSYSLQDYEDALCIKYRLCKVADWRVL